MANIPVERKGGGTPWWVWLLALLAIIGLIWLIAELVTDDNDIDDTTVTRDTLGVVDDRMARDTGVATTGTITEVSEVWEARRRGNLHGRQVRLEGVRATNVAGDSTFHIRDEDSALGPNAPESRLLVVLENLGETETYAPGPEGSDGRYNINEGEIMTVEGRVERFTGTERQVAGQNRDRLMPDSLYINAQRITSDEDQVRSEF